MSKESCWVWVPASEGFVHVTGVLSAPHGKNRFSKPFTGSSYGFLVIKTHFFKSCKAVSAHHLCSGTGREWVSEWVSETVSQSVSQSVRQAGKQASRQAGGRAGGRAVSNEWDMNKFVEEREADKELEAVIIQWSNQISEQHGCL